MSRKEFVFQSPSGDSLFSDEATMTEYTAREAYVSIP